MKKSLSLSMIVALLWSLQPHSAAQAPVARTVTDIKGRAMEVTILSADTTTVKVRRKTDGQEFALAIATLSKADQDFISSWAEIAEVVPSKETPKTGGGDDRPVPDAAKSMPELVYLEPEKKAAPGILPVTDWLNRGMGLGGVFVDERLQRTYVPLSRTQDADIAVFQYDDSGTNHRATWKGFGQCLFAHEGKLVTLTVAGDVVCWDAGDVNKPIRLQTEKAVIPPNASSCTATAGEYLYVSGWNHLTVIKTLPGPKNGFKVVGQSVSGPVDAMHVIGERLYTVTQSLGKYSVTVFDINREAKPTKENQWEFDASSYDLKNIAGGAVVTSLHSGRFLLIGSSRGENQVHVFDLSNPKKPKKMASYAPKEYYGGSLLAVDDSTVIIAENMGRFQSHKMDASGNLEPISEKVKNPLGWSWPATAMVAGGSRVFATGWDSNLSVLKAQDPAKLAVESVHNPHPASPDFLFDGETFVTRGSEKDSSQCYAINEESGRLGCPFQTLKGGVLALDAGRILLKSGNHVSLQEVKAGAVHACSEIPEPMAQEAEIHGHLLRITRHPSTCVIYDISNLKSPKKTGEMTLPEMEPNSFPGIHRRDIALFSHFVAIRDTKDLKIYDARKLEAGPVLTLAAAGPLGHAGDILSYASDGEINLLTASGGILKRQIYRTVLFHDEWKWPIDKGHKVHSDGKNIVLWAGEVASVFEIVPDSSGLPGIRKLGASLMPRCECHGGWYASVKNGFFITADAFAGVSIMKINPDQAGKAGPIIKPVK